MRKPAFIIILLGVIALSAGTAATAVRYVPGDYTTIQEAINASNNGDTVIVALGTYIGEGNRDIDFLGKAITVTSINPDDPYIVAATIIDCNGSATEPHRGFYFHSGEDANSVAAGFTIINGYGFKDPNYYDWSLGGGVYCAGSGPTITNCVITGNKATQGAGIFAWENSNPKIDKCTIINNEANGGIYCWPGTSAIITNCIVCGNSGRGIFCWDNLGTEISNCEVTDNGMYGIDIARGTATIGNCIVSNNHGSGIHCSGSAMISNCVISGNTESLGGGGISALGVITIKNSTITRNSAGIGGGVCCSLGKITIINSIVSDNTDEDIYVWNYPPPPGTPPDSTELTVSYSCPGVIVNDDAILILGEGNIDVDPCFADPCGGDYHLKSQAGRWDPNSGSFVTDANTSPCIDAGNPGCPLGDEPSDANNVRINMGAYGGTAEASKTPSDWRSIADLTNDWAVDIYDLGVLVGYWLDSGECIPGDLNRNKTVNFVDYTIFAQQWLPQASGDHTPPSPDPMTWATSPTATGPTTITMTSTTATDIYSPPVMYYFECTNDSNASSNWQASPTYTATGLTPSTQYTFKVKARDSATPIPNETGWSTPGSATTPAFANQPPAPVIWEVEPYETGGGMNAYANMTAAEAIDPEGNDPVEYYFECVDAPSLNSGWMTDRVWNDVPIGREGQFLYFHFRVRDSLGETSNWSTSWPCY